WTDLARPYQDERHVLKPASGPGRWSVLMISRLALGDLPHIGQDAEINIICKALEPWNQRSAGRLF
ncbi:MAG TPA: hypothetical protein VN455_09550, partial [Methanotrichaceae archaeon]|nr:hypothetical protein [Methanotrichaceae archaeon]